jgi:hypothetical protein
MSSIQPLQFNWLPQKSAWQQAQDWRTNQANLQSDADLTSAIMDKLSTATINSINGQGNLAAQAALDRINAAIKKKQDAQQAANDSALNSLTTPSAPTSISLSDGQVVAIDPAITLAGGSKLNPDTGVLTLTDGTMIDTKTGLKIDPNKVDTTV